MSRDTLPKFNWKRAIRNGLGYGLALEIAAIGTGYYLYREYKTNEGKDFSPNRWSNLKVNSVNIIAICIYSQNSDSECKRSFPMQLTISIILLAFI